MSTPEMPSSMDAVEVVKAAESGALPGAEIAGPMALDVAISEQAATIKGVNNAVSGKADVLLVPNLEAGNILFKQMVYSTECHRCRLGAWYESPDNTNVTRRPARGKTCFGSHGICLCCP